MRLLRDRYRGTLRGQHPYRNLQSLTNRIHDGNRTVAPLGAANHLENSVAERMERIEDLHARIFCAQGIVGADGCTLMCIASFRPADSRQIARRGSVRGTPSSYQSRCSAVCSEANL